MVMSGNLLEFGDLDMNLRMIKFYVMISASKLYEPIQGENVTQGTGLKLGSQQDLMAEVRRGNEQRRLRGSSQQSKKKAGK